MSEVSKTFISEKTIRSDLLASTSALVLALIFGIPHAKAADTAPTVWIELGGQLERRIGGDQQLVPMFTQELISREMISPLDVQAPPPRSFGGEGKILFAPDKSDWTLSASIRLGRSNGSKHGNQQTPLPPVSLPGLGCCVDRKDRASDVQARYDESHTIIDFEAGRDVGIGALSRTWHSSIAVGLRIAQFSNDETLSADVIPTTNVSLSTTGFPLHETFHNYVVSSSVKRSFYGIGPSIKWNGNVPLTGSADTSEWDIDWEIRGVALFGRQKALLHLQTTDNYHYNFGFSIRNRPYEHLNVINRARSVIVPNAGAALALSLEFPNAKMTMGYRVDYYFGAMDTGIDVRRSSNVLLHGPYASVSIGISPFGL